MRRILVLFLLLIIPLVIVPAEPLAAQTDTAERILMFDSRALFQPDGVMRVEEHITVNARGRDIRRGLIRLLPLRWDQAEGQTFPLAYDIDSVTRNGIPEPFVTGRERGHVSVRMGDAEVVLPRGTHTYVLTYRIRNHFSRFPDWDELYWNVTGNDWAFSIDTARFRLGFVEEDGVTIRPVSFHSIDAYTGPRGAKGQNARLLADGSVETTVSLRPGEGVTVAYTWDRAVLAGAPDPRALNRVFDGLVPDEDTLALWIVPLAMGTLFLIGGWMFRPKGWMPDVRPVFKPPKDMSPGMMRFVLKENYDERAFAADLLNLVAKGAVRLRQRAGGTVKLTKIPEEERRSRTALSEEEEAMMSSLFPKGKKSLTFDDETSHDLLEVRRYLSRCRAAERRSLFTPFHGYWLGISCLVLFLPLLATLLSPSGRDLWAADPAEFIVLMLEPLFFLFFPTIIAAVMKEQLLRAVHRYPAFYTLIDAVPVMLLIIMAYPFVAFLVADADMPRGALGAALLCLLASALFYWKAPRHTMKGLERRALAKGLRLYLSTIGEKRFADSPPPGEDIGNFEELLPYALALDAGRTWADALAVRLSEDETQDAQFRDFRWEDVERFRRTSDHASSPPPSRSDSDGSSSGDSFSSGSSGGGSSGGGSGGGGGRGW